MKEWICKIVHFLEEKKLCYLFSDLSKKMISFQKLEANSGWKSLKRGKLEVVVVKNTKIPRAITSLQEGQWAIFLEENTGFCKISGFKRRRKQTILFVACLCKGSDEILGKNQASRMWKNQWWRSTNHSSRGKNKGRTEKKKTTTEKAEAKQDEKKSKTKHEEAS